MLHVIVAKLWCSVVVVVGEKVARVMVIMAPSHTTSTIHTTATKRKQLPSLNQISLRSLLSSTNDMGKEGKLGWNVGNYVKVDVSK